MPPITKPVATTASAVTACTATSVACSAPPWLPALLLTAGLTMTIAEQIRTDRSEKRDRTRQAAADEQLRRLEQQAVCAARAIADPHRRAEVLLQLIAKHTHADDHVH